jgi:hypothetical protein
MVMNGLWSTTEMTNEQILELAKTCGFDSFTGEKMMGHKLITGSVGKNNS